MTSATIRPLCVYVDVDDTLIRSVGSKRIPIPSVIRHIRELYGRGTILYCWSSGGADYARESATEVGLADCFVAFLPKPNVIIDDQLVTEWPQFLYVNPTSCRTLDEYRSSIHGTIRTSPGD